MGFYDCSGMLAWADTQCTCFTVPTDHWQEWL